MEGACGIDGDILEKILKENLCAKTDGRIILKAF
jgi:hypothetical protein